VPETSNNADILSTLRMPAETAYALGMVSVFGTKRCATDLLRAQRARDTEEFKAMGAFSSPFTRAAPGPEATRRPLPKPPWHVVVRDLLDLD